MEMRKQESLPQDMSGSVYSPPSKSFKPETSAGSNVLIIEKIVQHLEFQDLMKCRHVNSVWEPIATTRLIRLNGPSRYFQYHYIPKCYLDNENRPLSDLIECARNSVKFPCTSFTFRGGDLCSEDAKEFFTVMGHSVKTLTLFSVDNVDFTSNMNLTTILNQTPNLETLILNGGSYYDSNATVELQSLKCIQIACRFNASFTPGIMMLLNGAPNLERIDGVWRLVDLEPIVTMNKIHTIKSWCPSRVSFLAGLIQLATATEDGLTLNELVVFIGERNVHLNDSDVVDADLLWKCYQNILDKNSIQKLILTCSKFPVNASFPLNMENVKELVLMPNSNPKTLRHFPLNINLCSTFPRLHTLSFYDPLYELCDGRNWSTCFPLSEEFENFNEILPTVTTLNLRGYSTSIRMLRKMKKMCPNVQNLEIHLNGILDKRQIVWELCGEWRHLKKLSINLDECKLVSKDNLDRVFTGIGPEFLESLNNDQSLTEARKLKKAEDERFVLWIGNITGLIQLDVEYKIPHGHRPDQSNNKILIPFTRSSGQYAFNMMPKLAVKLHYLKCSCCADSDALKGDLHSISPFATIVRR